MFRKTLIATAAAAVLSAGAMAATTTTAAAAPYTPDYGYKYPGPGPSGSSFGYKGDGFYLNFGFGNDGRRWDKPRVRKVCGPTYKTVKVWQKYYGWVWKTVYAGTECKFVPYQKWDKHDWDRRDW